MWDDQSAKDGGKEIDEREPGPEEKAGRGSRLTKREQSALLSTGGRLRVRLQLARPQGTDTHIRVEPGLFPLTA